MIELSTRTKASYTYVKDWMMLRECVAGCLGSMQTTSHQNVKLKLRLPEGSPAKFVKISGALQITKRATGKDAEAALGDLRFGDKRGKLNRSPNLSSMNSEPFLILLFLDRYSGSTGNRPRQYVTRPSAARSVGRHCVRVGSAWRAVRFGRTEVAQCGGDPFDSGRSHIWRYSSRRHHYPSIQAVFIGHHHAACQPESQVNIKANHPPNSPTSQHRAAANGTSYIGHAD